MTRRTAFAALAAAIGYLYGKPVGAQQRLILPLDGVDAIVVQYRGQTRIVSPQAIMDALAPDPSEMYMQRKK